MKTQRIVSPPGACRRGFTLFELLTVLVIISIISALVVTAVTSLGKSDGFNNATTTISTLLEQARAYAMANNTYVFVGFEETDGSQPAGGPQNSGAGYVGRVAIQAFASMDGTMNLGTSSQTGTSNLVAINKLQILNNIDFPSKLNEATGTLPNRPASPDYILGSASFPTIPSANFITARNFTFSKVIAFDSLGVVHLPTSPVTSGFQYIEIDAQPTNGSVISPNGTNVSAIELDATTGAVTVYRS
jgi:prepilin-type N-terminal cleavage/methylation domain-containing protein